MKKIILPVLAFISLLAACGPINPDAADSGDTAVSGHRAVLIAQPIAPLDREFVQGVNKFGFNTAMLLLDDTQNLALSPASVTLALAMTHAGASGDTADEMLAALCLDGMTNTQIENACKSLMWRANTGGLEAANAIWVDPAYPFSNEFIETCTNGYMADAMPLALPGAMDAINEWADEKTHGRIRQIINRELDPATKIVLCNALQYLGEWETPFEAYNTRDDRFDTPAGDVTASFMQSTRQLPYYADDAFSMISLDFKSAADEGQYAMAFLLPAENKDVADMLSRLDGGTFSAALSGMAEQQVNIKLPKFEYAFAASLNDTLKSLGMQTAFSGSADFRAMTAAPNDLYISNVLHKCYVRIDELGAEAAAVTVVEAPACEAPSENEPAAFYADRPFMFIIYSREDNAIVFMGVVNDPTQP